MSKPTTIKNADERCPGGKYNYSRHRTATIKRGRITNGIQKNTEECKLCGGRREVTLEYNVTAGLFSL
jgi:hypothetical protein